MSTDAPRTSLLSDLERRQMLRDGVALISSSHLAAVFGSATSLMIRLAVSPALMGIWATVRIVLEYGGYSSLGVNRAAALKIAIASGRDDKEAKRHTGNVAITIEVLSGLVVVLGLVSAGAFQAWRGEINWAVSYWLAAVIAVVGRYHAFSLTVLRSEKQFSAIARARVVGATVDLVCLAGGAWCFGYFGLIAGAVVAQVINACYVQKVGNLHFVPAKDLSLCKELLSNGWAMAAAALALVMLRSVDSLVIVNSLPNGAEQLGWYSAAMLLGRWAFEQSTLISNVVYPRLAETMGRTSDPEGVLRLGLRTADVLGLVMVPCAALLLVIGMPLLKWLLPDYRPGFEAAGGLVAASALLGISVPLRYALFAVGSAVATFLVTAFATVISLCGAIWMLRTGGGLAHVAWSSAVAGGVSLTLMAMICSRGRRRLWTVAFRLALTSTYMVLGVAVLQAQRWDSPSTWLLAVGWCVVPGWMLVRQIPLWSLPRYPSDQDQKI